jgi:hypothetical protein
MDDLLFDDDPDEDTGPPINVLAVGYPAESSEQLTIREAAMRTSPDYAGAGMVLFEEDGEFANAAEFKRAMRSARLPTMAEAGEWLLHKRDAVDARIAARVAAAGDD